MEYTPLSSFKRPITYAHLNDASPQEPTAPPSGINKWQLLRELSKAQACFALKDREITVLQALLSFHGETILGGNSSELVVYPSNKAICERLNGMPDSTMRRHLAVLINSGMVERRDSPNGKRYCRKFGDEQVAFGFDLTPLLVRYDEICRAAEGVREAEERLKRLREIVSLMRRDLAALSAFGLDTRPDECEWDEFSDMAADYAKALRRKLDIEALESARVDLFQALETARSIIDGLSTEEMNTCDVRSEQHYHNSNKNLHVFEPPQNEYGAEVGEHPEPTDEEDSGVETNIKPPVIPLHLVKLACPTIKIYHEDPIRHWHQLYDAACKIRPSMGISPSAWEEAKQAMGPETASIVILAMLERFEEIRSPGGYLRSLSAKAELGEFSCGPMVMALLNRKDAA